MEILASNKYGILRESCLQDFETTIGTRLPETYRQFLLDHNGGYPKRIIYPLPDTFVTLIHVFGLHNGPEFTRLDKVLEEMKESIPPQLIPFGRDAAGNMYCISIAVNEYGYIYFWEINRDDHDKHVMLLKKSFAEFLSHLQEEEL